LPSGFFPGASRGSIKDYTDPHRTSPEASSSQSILQTSAGLQMRPYFTLRFINLEGPRTQVNVECTGSRNQPGVDSGSKSMQFYGESAGLDFPNKSWVSDFDPDGQIPPWAGFSRLLLQIAWPGEQISQLPPADGSVCSYESDTRNWKTEGRPSALHDVWTLSRRFDFDGTKLAEAIRLTFEHRDTVLPSAIEAFTETFITALRSLESVRPVADAPKPLRRRREVSKGERDFLPWKYALPCRTKGRSKIPATGRPRLPDRHGGRPYIFMRGGGQYVGHERLRTHQLWWTRKKPALAFPFMVPYPSTCQDKLSPRKENQAVVRAAKRSPWWI